MITGGAGFIGSHLADKLLKLKEKVIVIDNLSNGSVKNIEHNFDHPNFEFIECNINDENKVNGALKGVEKVFHLAALADIVPSITEPKLYFDSNVKGTFTLLNACHNNSIKKFIYSASSSCYGIPKNYPTDENEKIETKYPYALTKFLGEEMVMHWEKIYGLNALSLRFFNVYGPRSRTSGTYGAVFGVFLAQILSQIPLTIVGDGKQKRDFTFVSDVVDALILASKSDCSGECFNVGSNNPVSILKLAELLGQNNIEFIPKRPGEPDNTFADISKISQQLGWSPKVSIEEGIKVMLDNIEYWRDAPVWTPDKIEVATREWFKYLK